MNSLSWGIWTFTQKHGIQYPIRSILEHSVILRQFSEQQERQPAKEIHTCAGQVVGGICCHEKK